MKPFRLVAPFLCLVLAAPSLAQGGGELRYAIDPAASTVDARVAFFGISSKTAHFPDVSGALTLSTSDFETISLSVDVDARTLTTGDAQTARLRGRQFFDVKHYPTVRFTGQHLQMTGPRTATVTGQMTARGVTRPSTIALTFSKPPIEMTGTEAVGVVGTTIVDRRLFGMTAFPLLVGNQVAVTIRARMVPGQLP